MNVKVMTFNIHHGKGTDKKVDLDRIAELISKTGADIIGLNEVDQHFSKRSHHVDQAKELAGLLGMEHVFCPAIVLSKRNNRPFSKYGNGLLCRYPILNPKCHSFSTRIPIIESRSIIETSITIKQKPIRILVAHLSISPYLHRKQSEFVLDAAKRSKEPTIILGDWNMLPNTSRWKRVESSLIDVWDEIGRGKAFTYPSWKPKKRLDYILCSEEIGCKTIEVVTACPNASDHLPVLATLSI